MGIFSIANTFIKRPVLTTVCTLLILLVGAVCIPLLPINYLPDISPIQIRISSFYTGADAETVENTVTTILERELNGVEGMESMSSQTFAGRSNVTVTFPSSTDKNINQVNVQNRVAQAVPRLPSPVQQRGVATRAASTSILRVYGFYAENGEYDSLFISNYIDTNIIDVLRRVDGVGDAALFGDRATSMRVWLDPSSLAGRGLTALDVINSLRSQNVAVGLGALGQEPVPPGQSYELPLRVQGQLATVTEFENIVLRSQPGGSLTRLRDVGRAELGAENYLSRARVKGKDAVGIALYQLPGSNALDVADRVEEVLEELKANFPPGLKAEIVYDTTDFIKVSIREVLITLFQAVLLVILVIFLFLQDWRTTIIPTVAIPVALIGALAFAFVFGFSINTLTLFGMILATGLVVDDAIVIVEAVATKIEEGLTAKEASVAVMNEMSGAVVSTSLVLMAVFIPVAFFPGTTGKLYQQFALFIAFSVAVSTFNALSFSPSMAAILLKPRQGEPSGPLGLIFRPFNRFLSWLTVNYAAFVGFLIRIRYVVMVIFVIGLVATVQMFRTVPTGFVPAEDQGAALGIVQAPDGVSLNYTNGVIDQVEAILAKESTIESYFTASGAGLEGNGPNLGIFFMKLKSWDQRTTRETSVMGILRRLTGQFNQIQEATVRVFNPPAIPGFGATGGVEFELQDQTGGRLTLDDLLANARDIIGVGMQKPAVGMAFTQFTVGTPQLRIDIDRSKLEALNVDFQQALQTIGTAIGSTYVNDFVLGTRSYRVFVQAEGEFRQSPDDLNRLYVRSRSGALILFKDLATITPVTGPQTIFRYNGYRSVKVQAAEAPGFSTGQVLQSMDAAVQEKAIPGVSSDWIGLAKEQLAAGSLGALIFLFGIIIVFLTLSAQYESYIDPIIILLTVPLAMLGALLFISWRGLVNDVYANVALVMLIGLASKNAILIVEFANQARAEGASLVKAAQQAAQERFRPILMTAISSLVGFFPLLIATGAGAASRWSIGYALFGGLLVATVLSFLVVPVLYVVIKSLEAQFLGGRTPPAPPVEPPLSANFEEMHQEIEAEPPVPQRFQEDDHPTPGVSPS